MKDTTFVQRYWKTDFLTPLAVSAGLDDFTKSIVAYEVGKEVEWLLRMLEPEGSLNLRVAKIDMLMTQYEGDISHFDQYANYRRAFFEYVLA